LRDGTFVNTRRAEAILMAVTLRDTLQKSGHWGSVWAAPRASTAADLIVESEILQSDGNVVDLKVRAYDQTGRVWLDGNYDMETAAGAYNRQRYPALDPYQDVFNSIANDLAAARAALAADQIEGVRAVSELRYASELSPEAFGGYLEERRGVYEVVRLPAVDDPTLARTRAVRQREQLFMETLDQHYDVFALDAVESYDGWREAAREDSIRLQQAARAAKVRTGLGALTILMSIAYGSNADSSSLIDRAITDAGVYIGFEMIQAASIRRQERRLHQQALQELSESFDDSIKPLVVEVQGTQHRLTGTADAQYDEWRNLIRQLYISETGLAPEDIEVYLEPSAEAETAPETQAAPPTETEAAASPSPEPESEEAPSNASGGQVTGA
jgi:hypothetical protein